MEKYLNFSKHKFTYMIYCIVVDTRIESYLVLIIESQKFINIYK